MRFSALVLALATVAAAAPLAEEQAATPPVVDTEAPVDANAVPVDANAKPIILPFLGAGAGLLGAGIANAVGIGAAALGGGALGLARGFGERLGDRIGDIGDRFDNDRYDDDYRGGREIVYVPVQGNPNYYNGPPQYSNAPPPGYYNGPPPQGNYRPYRA